MTLELLLKATGTVAHIVKEERASAVRISQLESANGDGEYKSAKAVRISLEEKASLAFEKYYNNKFLVVTEENKRAQPSRWPERTVILDTIDGTKNYALSTQVEPADCNEKITNSLRPSLKLFWGISAVELYKGEPIAGVIRYPDLGVVLVVEKGNGTYIQQGKMNHKITLNYESKIEEDYVRISGTSPNSMQLREHLLPAGKTKPRHFGSLVATFLGLILPHDKGMNQPNPPLEVPVIVEFQKYAAYLGCGQLGWDIGCTTLAYTEAGGLVLNGKGKSLNPFDNMINHASQEWLFMVPNRNSFEYLQQKVSEIVHF